AIELDNDGSKQTVEGYIVGYVVSQTNVSDDENDFGDTNVALADEADETNLDNMLFVQVSSEFREKFGMASNPNILGEEILVTGSMEAYFSHYGLKSPSDMRFASENDEPDE